MPTISRQHWMNRQPCCGQWPVALPDHLAMSVPPTVKVDTQAHLQTDTQETVSVSPSKIRRRASQGSLRTRPSPVSRFLSKSSVAVNFPSWEHRTSGSRESRPRSADSRLRLSTTVSRGPRPLTASPAWNTPPAYQSEYPSTLPPTPPEDDIHVAWNPKSDMLLFNAHPHQHPTSMKMMDESPGVDNSPTTGASDTLSSPSDGLSHGSSSSGGSPGPHDEMDCQQDIGSWLDHGINLTGRSAVRSAENHH
jgi:hypothetical protein